MKENFSSYLHCDYKCDTLTKLTLCLAVGVASAVAAFVYKFIFCLADRAFMSVSWPASTFGPWIDLAFIFSIIMFLALYRLRAKPWLLITVCAVGGFIIKLLAALLMYLLFDGARGWNCSLEILNLGSVVGFVCVRNLLEYAAGGALLFYVIIPLIFGSAKKMKHKTFSLIWLISGGVCLLDIIVSDFIIPFV